MAQPVRSGRTAPGVVVLGTGPLAGAVAAWFAAGRSTGDADTDADSSVLTLAELPPSGAEDLVRGARAVVLVADDADLSTPFPGSAQPGAGAGQDDRASEPDPSSLPSPPVRPDAPGPARRRAVAVERAARAVDVARAAGVPQLVAVTSAMVHGAAPDRPPIADDEPLLESLPEGQVGDLLAVEAVLAEAAGAPEGPTILVVRPCAVVGPGVDTLITRHFAAPRLLAVRGVERPWQLVHADDVASAVALGVERGWAGSLVVGAEPVLSADQVREVSGMRRLELPAVAAFGTAERLARVGVLPVPASELAYAVYPWTVDPARLREAGWTPAYDGEACLRVLVAGVRGRFSLAGRQVESREVALGAAGAAVALLGTAAAWRQARGRLR